MGARATTKAFIIRQPEKMSMPPRRGQIPRLDCLSSRYPDGRRANQGHT